MQKTTKKVKQGTKGQKQIVTENQETIVLYRYMMLIASAIYVVGKMVFSTFTNKDIFFTLFSVLLHAGCYKLMEYMSRAKYSSTGQLVDSGVDLNMEGGIAESVKDVIILTSICQVTSLYSNYVWLFMPLCGFHTLWMNVLNPYLFQQGQNNQEPETNDKKQKKRKKKSKWIKMI